MTSIKQQFEDLESLPVDGFQLSFEEGLQCVYGLLMGPEDTPYEGGLFFFKATIDTHSSLQIRIVTKIFNPSVDSSGNVSLRRSDNLRSMLEGLMDMLKNPKWERPLNVEAADLYFCNEAAFYQKAVVYTLTYAH